MSGKILDSLWINARVQKIGDISMAEQMRRHLKINAIHQIGIVRLMSTEGRCNGTLYALTVDIGIIIARFGGTDNHILPYSLKL